jgi:hypothetical protein
MFDIIARAAFLQLTSDRLNGSLYNSKKTLLGFVQEYLAAISFHRDINLGSCAT